MAEATMIGGEVADPKDSPAPAGDKAEGDKSSAAASDKAADKSTTSEPKPSTETKESPEFEVRLPEGIEPDSVLLEKFKPLAKELGLKSEGAQKLVDLAIEMQTKAAATATETAKSQWEAETKKWAETVRADKEIGGADFEKNVAMAKQAVARFGGKELAEYLDASGLGNHPSLVKAFVKIGKEIAEDSSEGRRGSGPPKGASDPMRERYPNSPQLHKNP